ncbi:MAG: hypothetical protein U0165_16520 [Polyangiaceae bacterium]
MNRSPQVPHFGGALAVGVVGRDMVADPGDTAESTPLHLFTANHKRARPESLLISAQRLGATIAAIALALMASHRLRKVGAGALAGLALGFTRVWGSISTSSRRHPHWGRQREIIEAYYRAQTGPNEPLVGYQMNRKGEMFYSGNHLLLFAKRRQLRVPDSSTHPRDDVLLRERAARINGLKGELGNPVDVKQLTDKVIGIVSTALRVQSE